MVEIAPDATAAIEASKPDSPAAEIAQPQPSAAETPVAADVSPAAPVDEPTLLESIGKEKPKAEPETKVAAEAAGETEKPDEAAGEAETGEAGPAVYPDYELPDRFEKNPEIMQEFTGILGEFKVPAEAGPKLIALADKIMARYDDSVRENVALRQVQDFVDYKKRLQLKAMADPQIGGAAWQTASVRIAEARDRFLSAHARGTPEYEADARDFDRFMASGAGNDRALLRMLHNIGEFIKQPSVPSPQIKPVPNNGRAPNSKGLKRIYAETRESRGR